MIFKCAIEVKKDQKGETLKNCIVALNEIPNSIHKKVTPVCETKERIAFILTLQGNETDIDKTKESLKDYFNISMEIPDEATV